jgi:hypothetical protein
MAHYLPPDLDWRGRGYGSWTPPGYMVSIMVSMGYYAFLKNNLFGFFRIIPIFPVNFV